jgi:hypothetical protein
MHGSIWIAFFTVSLINYGLSMSRSVNGDSMDSMETLLVAIDFVIGITEFAIYFLLNVICLETFLMMR